MWGRKTSSREVDMKVRLLKLSREERRIGWFRASAA